LVETNTSTAYLLFDRGLCEPVKDISPWEGFRKQFRKVLIEFIESRFGVGAIAEKVVILGLR
jgi:hypothetical protein